MRIESFLHRRFSLTGITTVEERFARTFHPARSHFGKQRITLYFDTPAVVIRQVQMQFVQLQHSHAVNDAQQVFFGSEETAYVNH